MKKIDKRIVFSLILIFFFFYTIYAVVAQEVKIYTLGVNIKKTEVQIKKAEEQYKELTEERENLKNLDYIEKVAREELGVTKPGEIPYIPSHKNND